MIRAQWLGDLGDKVHTGNYDDPRCALIEVIPTEIRYVSLPLLRSSLLPARLTNRLDEKVVPNQRSDRSSVRSPQRNRHRRSCRSRCFANHQRRRIGDGAKVGDQILSGSFPLFFVSRDVSVGVIVQRCSVSCDLSCSYDEILRDKLNYTLASSTTSLAPASAAPASTVFLTLSAYSPAVMILGPSFAPSTASNPTRGCVSFVMSSVVTGSFAEASFITACDCQWR